jgi:starch phosphorylase
MQPIYTYHVVPALPEPLRPLQEIASNLWWCWNLEAIDLFRRLDRDLWEEVQHNPIWMLGRVKQEVLAARAEDEGFLAQQERVWQQFQNYLHGASWYDKTFGRSAQPIIAYFSAEFGLTECLPIYSGGLGILAGDHLKSASDLGLPLVGVGLLYQQGYFRQYLNADGWQQESFPENDFYNLPVQLERDDVGDPLTVTVEDPAGPVVAQVWRVQVGRVPLYLLDTNLESNPPAVRDLTDQLYGGDTEMRIRQEILLGIGGLRALRALGIRPLVCHLNEGHSAFMALERIRMLMEERGLPFQVAREIATAGNVFTTHTPVPAGHDVFPPELIDKYLASYYSALKLSREEFLALGRQNPQDSRENFSMPVLALHLSAYSNGVSKLHGRVARRMWRGIWPQVPEEEIPLTSVTNGVHIPSWISGDMAQLLERYLGPRWREEPAASAVWERIDHIPSEELWLTHERRRERLVAFARQRLKWQLERRNARPSEIAFAEEVLHPEALTIGFGRRFATYKRATLLLRDPERLLRILDNRQRPVQILYAGKAHPRDNEGKEFIRQIIHLARREGFRRRIVFLEDYDMNVARYLVQGVDVWLNNPRRPLEASGTSGMKVAANGGLNLSVLDGWWDEAYRSELGWAIGRGEVYDDLNYQDQVESEALYDLLEEEVVPLFYQRGPDGLPDAWIRRMKTAMKTICPVFNTDRMVHEYMERFYHPAAQRVERLMADGAARALALAEWKALLREHWSKVRVESVESDGQRVLKVGSTLKVWARVALGPLRPEDVAVEIYQGQLDAKGMIVDGRGVRMKWVQAEGSGRHTFIGEIPCQASGLHGYTLRILPCHEDLLHPFEPGLIYWQSQA